MVRQTLQIKGDIPSIVRNDRGLYLGNLSHYFRAVFFNAPNVNHPYHNFRHMCHVLYLCYDACVFYADVLTSREMRNLLIAALFHDFDHTGVTGDDSVNIERAVEGLRAHISDDDLIHFNEIAYLIRCTEFPYKLPSDKISLSGQIIRDADLSQNFSVAWIQQVVFGLAREWGKDPIDVLKMQEGFMNNVLQYHTEWGMQKFPATDIAAKIAEAQELVVILTGPVSVL